MKLSEFSIKNVSCRLDDVRMKALVRSSLVVISMEPVSVDTIEMLMPARNMSGRMKATAFKVVPSSLKSNGVEAA